MKSARGSGPHELRQGRRSYPLRGAFPAPLKGVLPRGVGMSPRPARSLRTRNSDSDSRDSRSGRAWNSLRTAFGLGADIRLAPRVGCPHHPRRGPKDHDPVGCGATLDFPRRPTVFHHTAGPGLATGSAATRRGWVADPAQGPGCGERRSDGGVSAQVLGGGGRRAVRRRCSGMEDWPRPGTGGGRRLACDAGGPGSGRHRVHAGGGAAGLGFVRKAGPEA